MSNVQVTEQYTYQGDPAIEGQQMSHLVIEAQEQDRLVGFGECKTVENGEPLVSIGVRDYVIIFAWNGKRAMIKAGTSTNIDELITEEMKNAEEVEFSIVAGPAMLEGNGPKIQDVRARNNFKQVDINPERKNRFEDSAVEPKDMNIVFAAQGVYVIDNN